MTWGAIASSVVSAGVGMYGAKKQSDAMKKAGAAATPVPYSGVGPAGTTMFDPKTRQFQLQLADSPFYNMFTGLGLTSLANAATAPGSPLYGAPPEVVAAYQGLSPEGLQESAAGRYDLLTQLAQPQEQRAFQGLENRLFARGQMGTSGGGEQYRGFEEARQQADLMRQVQSQDWATTNALNRFNAANQAVGTGMTGQMNQANIAGGAFGSLQNALGSLYQQANIGLGSASGMPSNIAMAQAQAAGTPYQFANEFLTNSGAYDWLGGKLGGLFGGGYQPGSYTLPSMGGVGGGGAPLAVNGGGAVNIPTQPLNFNTPTYDFGS